MGELAPNNIDGHLNIQIPLAAIHNHIQNIRKELEENKKKRGKTTSTSMCLDDCKPNKYGIFDRMVDASYKTREQCQNLGFMLGIGLMTKNQKQLFNMPVHCKSLKQDFSGITDFC